MKRFKITTVIERFRDPVSKVPKERLACGHIRTDPALFYDGERAFQIKRVAESLSNDPIKARCYKCGRGE